MSIPLLTDGLRGRLLAVVVLVASVFVLALSVPRLRASLSVLPADAVQSRYAQTGEFPTASMGYLTDVLVSGIENHDDPAYWAQLGLIHFIRAESASDDQARGKDLALALQATGSALARAPVAPDLWLRMAIIRASLEEPSSEVVAAWRLSIDTGRVEPSLAVKRVELGLIYFSALSTEDRLQLLDQARIGWEMKRADLAAMVRSDPRYRIRFRELVKEAAPEMLAGLDQA